MGSFTQEFPCRDSVCEADGPMLRYLHYYRRNGPNNLLRGHVYIGRHTADTEEVINIADRHIEMTPRTQDVPQVCYTVAATVMRLCIWHDEGAQMEVERQVIVVPPGEPARDVAIGNIYMRSGSYNYVPVQLRDAQPDPSMPHGLYLPRDDISAGRSEHQIVIGDRGGYSYPMMIGVLGGEEFVERPLLPLAGR